MPIAETVLIKMPVVMIATPVPMIAKHNTGKMFLKKDFFGKAFTAPSLMMNGRKKFMKRGSNDFLSLAATSAPLKVKMT